MKNNTTVLQSSETMLQQDFEFRIALVVGITFTFTFVVGLIGNTLVLLTVLLQKKMHNATNILILNLAIAELLFIIICVPFTGLNYVLSFWYFGDIICRIMQYTSNVTAYLIVMLLVFMSIDRYLAVHSFSANAYRTKLNAIKAVTILWLLVLILNLPQLYLYSSYEYLNSDEPRAVCILKYNTILAEETDDSSVIQSAELKLQLYYLLFFMFAYVIPLASIVIIYALIIIRLSKSKGKQVNKGKRRMTIMIIIVISSFAFCWAPIQIMFFLQHILKKEFNETEVTLLVISNCIGYLNACVNPIIYGFANKDFRAAYAAILKCQYIEKFKTVDSKEIVKIGEVKRYSNDLANNKSQRIVLVNDHNKNSNNVKAMIAGDEIATLI